MDYGSDAEYTQMMEEAFLGWEAWNSEWERPLYHADGILVRCAELGPGTFEGDSYTTLTRRGHPLQRLGTGGPSFAAWRGLEQGYFNPSAGWVESGEVVRVLAEEALSLGVRHLAETAVLDGSEVRTAAGPVGADVVVVATGCWTPALLPELADRLCAVGQPVLHFKPAEPERWRGPAFPPWAADIANTGWYGFPANAEGHLKIAHHGPGDRVDPSAPRVVDAVWESRARAFFRAHLPGLADAPLVHTRQCVYTDSFDGDFFIDRLPERPEVVVASGGSGHGFKFAPLIGEMIASRVEGSDHRWTARFAHRSAGLRATEEARFSG